MKTFSLGALVACLVLLILLSDCSGKRARAFENFEYSSFKDSLGIENYDPLPDTSNIFDDSAFTPGKDSLQYLLVRIDTMWKVEWDSLTAETFLRRVATTKHSYSLNDSLVLVENRKVLDSFLVNYDSVLPGACREIECAVYAEIVKPLQKLYLYLDGKLVDSFKVSTGITKYETPQMNVRPLGPLFIKYTSRKFPGGNYEGLGNMPYAVFVRGGYAIHGTTPGNFARLGSVASHGCIRLHPNNARIFYELVKRAGLQNSWVKITNEVEQE